MPKPLRGVFGIICLAVALSPIPFAHAASCDGKLGVSRTVEIDTTGGPAFGFQHYKTYDFLQDKEVVLTFDDGPLPRPTRAILKALDAECTKATFFSVGKQAVASPEILRDIAKSGHTIGSHTYMHRNVRKLKGEKAIDEIERGVSAVKLAVGDRAAPFFRYPFLRDSDASFTYLGKRNIAIFSTDLDSFDFKLSTPKRLIRRVMSNLAKKGKGIILFHDIQTRTAKAMPTLLAELKKAGYKVVHLTAKAPVASLPEFDAKVKANFKSRSNIAGGRPMSSVIKTVEPK